MALAHDYKNTKRTSVLAGALMAGGLLFATQPAAAQGCSREILQGAADDYIEAQESAEPVKMHMGL